MGYESSDKNAGKDEFGVALKGDSSHCHQGQNGSFVEKGG